MRRIRYFVLGLLLAASVGAYAVSSGGFPSGPFFQFITNKSATGRLCNGTDTTIVCEVTTGAHATWAHLINASASNSLGLYIKGMTSTGAVGDSLLRVDANGFTPLQVNGDGSVTIKGGLTLPKFSFGEFIGNAGGCSNNSGVWQTQNMGGTCTRNSVGNYTISFSTSYLGSPICEAQVTSALAGIAGVNTAGTTSVTVQTGTTAFAAADSSFLVTCTGF